MKKRERTSQERKVAPSAKSEQGQEKEKEKEEMARVIETGSRPPRTLPRVSTKR